MIDVAHSYNMRIQFDAHQCRLAQDEIDKMLTGLDALGEQVKNFPVSDLHILVERNGRSNDFSVKTSLVLPGDTLVSSDHDPVIHCAFERCINNLVAAVGAYKERLGQVEERQKQQKGTRQDLQTNGSLDFAVLDAAVAADDYPRFRRASYTYEDPVRLRVGRWIERYPDQAARIDRGLKIADIVEEVFLQAFAGYAARPQGLRFGEWLENLIDPAVRTLLRKGDEELETINRMRSAVESEP
jgi:hypothetical protein